MNQVSSSVPVSDASSKYGTQVILVIISKRLMVLQSVVLDHCRALIMLLECTFLNYILNYLSELLLGVLAIHYTGRPPF